MSSVATRYQLGLDFQAASVTAPVSARTPHGTCVGHERGLGLVDIGGEGSAELRLVEEQEAILRRKDRRHRRAGGRVLDEGVNGLGFVRCKRRDVNEPRDLRVVSGFRDHHAAVGMADQHDRALGLCDDLPRGGNVVGQRRRRVLDDADVVATLLETIVDAFLAGAVDETAMHEDDADGQCLNCSHDNSPFRLLCAACAHRFHERDLA